jgi:DNA-binding GntR family transcriptional regulator
MSDVRTTRAHKKPRTRALLGRSSQAIAVVPTEERLGQWHLPLHAAVAGELRKAILAGRYAPGERLTEERLARDFAVSRNPVREAIRALASEGLVDVTARQGAMVPTLTPGHARELIEVRAAIEGITARLAAQRHDPKIIARLKDILRRGMTAVAARRMSLLSELNDQFHDALAEAGSNRVLGDLMRSLRDRTAPAFAPMTTRAADQTWKDHAAILRAVISGNENLAAQRAADHIHNVGTNYLAARQAPAKRKR